MFLSDTYETYWNPNHFLQTWPTVCLRKNYKALVKTMNNPQTFPSLMATTKLCFLYKTCGLFATRVHWYAFVCRARFLWLVYIVSFMLPPWASANLLCQWLPQLLYTWHDHPTLTRPTKRDAAAREGTSFHENLTGYSRT